MSIHQIIPIEYPHISYRSMSIHQIIPIESGECAQLSLPTNEYTKSFPLTAIHGVYTKSFPRGGGHKDDDIRNEYTPDHSHCVLVNAQNHNIHDEYTPDHSHQVCI